MLPAAVNPVSVEQFFEFESCAQWRNEYRDGTIVPLEPNSLNHGRISMRLGSFLHDAANDRAYQALGGIHVRATARHYLLPNSLVVGGQPELDSTREAITNPMVIFEILSPSTMDYAWGSKFATYRKLESLAEYVLIAEDKPDVCVFRKLSEREWLLTIHNDLEGSFPIASLGVELSMKELYARVEWPPEPDQS
ncbi:MAG: Uma2 family endonuclease [Acidobacteria bacterium]|nr:Uma2 family endonuclease [Acidobacteriota bacterium]